MEMGSDGEEDQIKSLVDGNNNNHKKKMKMIDNPKVGLVKPKRQMKTPFQLETLERVYSGSH